MDSVVAKLSEIESAAEAIVAHAETQKFEIEKKIQARRDQYDRDLEQDTMDKLNAIRNEVHQKTEAILSSQREKNLAAIDGLRLEYEQNHTAYAKEILRHITEV